MSLDLPNNLLTDLARLFCLVFRDLRISDESCELLLDLVIVFELLSFLCLRQVDDFFLELLTSLRLKILPDLNEAIE